MASLLLARTAGKTRFVANVSEHGSHGMLYANAAIEFAVLAQLGTVTKYHLFALAIELAFKSLVLRSGATLAECKTASHKISRMICLIENHGIKVSDKLKQRLNNDDWYKSMMDDRYPQWGNGPYVHSNYPEMIAEILEIECGSPLSFIANWNRHQSKKAATPVDAIAASAGSRGNVGKRCPAGHGESDQSTGTGNRILRFPILIYPPGEIASAKRLLHRAHLFTVVEIGR